MKKLSYFVTLLLLCSSLASAEERNKSIDCADPRWYPALDQPSEPTVNFGKDQNVQVYGVKKITVQKTFLFLTRCFAQELGFPEGGAKLVEDGNNFIDEGNFLNNQWPHRGDRDIHRGETLLAKGNFEIAQGQSDIEEGNKLINQGESDQGNALLKKGQFEIGNHIEVPFGTQGSSFVQAFIQVLGSYPRENELLSEEKMLLQELQDPAKYTSADPEWFKRFYLEPRLKEVEEELAYVNIPLPLSTADILLYATESLPLTVAQSYVHWMGNDVIIQDKTIKDLDPEYYWTIRKFVEAAGAK